ncbi:MAG: type II secretion system GspH family protein [Desulfovibrionales bacterium]|nr:type II secretion system GspH family protein [Desulfovibrionales bacterium]
MERKNRLKNQKGFTLIEIIVTLVILGILAAVAIPKFMDLTTEAEKKAREGALSAAYSNATISYYKFLLEYGKQPQAIVEGYHGRQKWKLPHIGTNIIQRDLGDYMAFYSYDDTTKEVTVQVWKGDSFEPPNPSLISEKSFKIQNAPLGQ